MKHIKNEADRIRQRGYELASKRKKAEADKLAGKVQLRASVNAQTNEFLKEYKERHGLNSMAESLDHIAENHNLTKEKNDE